MSNKLNVLGFINHYLPAYKAGGPVRTLSNMVDILGDDICFNIVTKDRDLGDKQPFKHIRLNQWVETGKAKVLYLSPDKQTFGTIRKLIESSVFNLIYLNSFLSPDFTVKLLLLRRLNLIPKLPVIVAPRGEFSPGHLAIKRWKYLPYIYCSKLFSLYHNIVWQASSEYEKDDLIHWFGEFSLIIFAPDLQSPNRHEIKSEPYKKRTGQLKIVFLSRISPKKNLDGALRMLQGIHGNVTFTILGPVGDRNYWNKCRMLIDKLPDNITVVYKGSILHENVIGELRNHDLFFLPTHGENYGHVIFEALSAGCPVLISDQTPWRNLVQKGIGWDIPLKDNSSFLNIIQDCVKMEGQTHFKFSNNARNFCKEYLKNNELVQMNKNLFYTALNR